MHSAQWSPRARRLLALLPILALSFLSLRCGTETSDDDDGGQSGSGNSSGGSTGTGSSTGSGGGDPILPPEPGVRCGEENDGTAGAGSGTVQAELRSLSRVDGVSPEVVYFSAQGTTDSSCEDMAGGSDMEACRTGQYLGFHFDFDDTESGNFSTTGNTKNEQVSGSPRAAHTFICEGPEDSRYNEETGRCEYAVRVRAQNPNGDYSDACLQVNITPQDEAYAPSDTYCVSADEDFEGCPEGVPAANLLTNTPRGSTYDGKRVLFARGSDNVYAPVCIGYADANVRVGAFGEGSDPIVEMIRVGAVNDCSSIPENSDIDNYDALAKDEYGYVTQGWAYDIGISDLRAGAIDNGVAATLVTLHNIDLDWSATGEFTGGVSIAANGQSCHDNPDLDCHRVQYPYGIFLSDIRTYANVSNLPGINVQCMTECGIVNSAMLGVEGKTAVEHNCRIMGSWGLVASNVWFKGDHVNNNAEGGGGGKSKITLRMMQSGAQASQVVNPENFTSGNHDGNGPGWQREQDPTRHFTPHYNFVIDGKFGDTTQNPVSSDAALVSINSGYQYSGVFGATFVTYPGADPNPTQLGLGGRNIVAVGTTYNGESVECRNTVDSSHEPVPNYYMDPSLIFADSEEARCGPTPSRPLPVPDSPAP